MPARPTQGSSKDTWGDELEANLAVSIDKDTGALVPASVQTAIAGTRPYVQDTDPSTGLASGTEYVWFQMDGAGNLVDIKYGKKP